MGGGGGGGTDISVSYFLSHACGMNNYIPSFWYNDTDQFHIPHNCVIRLDIPYLLVFKPLGLIYEVGLRFEFKPPGAYKRNLFILNVMCSTRLFAYKPPPLYLNSECICTIDDFQGFTYSVLPYIR